MTALAERLLTMRELGIKPQPRPAVQRSRSARRPAGLPSKGKPRVRAGSHGRIAGGAAETLARLAKSADRFDAWDIVEEAQIAISYNRARAALERYRRAGRVRVVVPSRWIDGKRTASLFEGVLR